MHVLLSIDAVRFPLTGVGRYVYELARALATSEEIDSLRFLAGSRLVDQLPEPGGAESRLQLLRRQLLKSRLAVSLFRTVSNRARSQVLKGQRHALFHGPSFYLPPHVGPSVATIHDLSVYHWAHCHPPERVRYMRDEIALTLRRADHLITDSEFTRQEVAAFFNWPLDRIHAVPLASAAEFRPYAEPELVPTLARYRLAPQGYSLYSGTIEPRKNLLTLLAAYEQLPPAVRSRWPLVLCGYSGWQSTDIHQRIEQAQRQGWARYLGYVPAADLPALCAGARLFLFPSLYEGFGLPVLEAMAAGTPVVCSSAGSLPEVAGTAALQCHPEEVKTLGELIHRGLTDDSWRALARTKGLAQAARFSWQRCARETTAVYQLASETHRTDRA